MLRKYYLAALKAHPEGHDEAFCACVGTLDSFSKANEFVGTTAIGSDHFRHKGLKGGATGVRLFWRERRLMLFTDGRPL